MVVLHQNLNICQLIGGKEEIKHMNTLSFFLKNLILITKKTMIILSQG